MMIICLNLINEYKFKIKPKFDN